MTWPQRASFVWKRQEAVGPASEEPGGRLRLLKKAIGSCRIGIDSRAFMATILINSNVNFAGKDLYVKKREASFLCGLLLIFVVQFSTNAFGQLLALSPLPQTGTLTPPANSAQFTFRH